MNYKDFDGMVICQSAGLTGQFVHNGVKQMKAWLALTGLFGLMMFATVHAAEENQEALIAQCEQEAKAQGVEDIDGFISACLDEKLGYEKEN